jgi:transposase-like protein
MMGYSELVRARMVRKMVGPNAVNASVLSKESGIPQPTLSRWRRGAGSLRLVTEKRDDELTTNTNTIGRRPQDWSPMERLQLLVESNGLSEQELGELLRKRGVHREQLDEWRAATEEAFARPMPSRKSPDAKRIKQLEREIARKDKALAEAGALLLLQKKVQALYRDGVFVGDDTGEENDE